MTNNNTTKGNTMNEPRITIKGNTPIPTVKVSPYRMVCTLEEYFTKGMNSDQSGIRYRVACTLVVNALHGVKVFM
jgi:hypothetical protein